MASIGNTATIDIVINVDKAQINQLKNAFQSIAGALDAQTISKRLGHLEETVTELQNSLKEAANTGKLIDDAVAAALASVRDETKKAIAEIEKSNKALRKEIKTLNAKNQALERSNRALKENASAARRAKKDVDALADAHVRDFNAMKKQQDAMVGLSTSLKTGVVSRRVRVWRPPAALTRPKPSPVQADDDFDLRAKKAEEAINAWSAQNRAWFARAQQAQANIDAWSAKNRAREEAAARKAEEKKNSILERGIQRASAFLTRQQVAEERRQQRAAAAAAKEQQKQIDAAARRAAADDAKEEKRLLAGIQRASKFLARQEALEKIRFDAQALAAQFSQVPGAAEPINKVLLKIANTSNVTDRALEGFRNQLATAARQAQGIERASKGFEALKADAVALEQEFKDLPMAMRAIEPVLRKIANASSVTENELKSLTNQLSEARAKANSASYTSRGLDALREQADALAQELSGIPPAMRALEPILRKLDGTADATESQLRSLTMQFDKASRSARKASDEWKGANGILAQLRTRVSDAEKRVDAIFRASYRLQMVGSTLKFWAMDIFRWGKVFVETFAEFEYMALRAQAAMSATGISTKDFQNSIVAMTKELKMFEAREVAEAMYYWGSTTGTTVETQKDLLSTLEQVTPVMQAAAMTNTGYEAAIKGVYSVLVQYNMGLSKTQQVTEQLFYITQKTAAEFPDLINSFKMVGPIASAVGVSFEEVVQVFGELADLGIRGTMSGRAFRQFFIQTLRPAPKAVEALNELFAAQSQLFDGKSYKEVMFPEGEFVGFTEYIQNLAKATLGLAASERATLLAKISTANELPMLIALVSKYRNEMLQTGEVVRKVNLDEASEYFRKNWEYISGSAKAFLGMIRNMVQSIQFEFGRGIVDALMPLADIAEDMTQKFQEFLRLNSGIVKTVANLAAMAAVVAAVAGAVLIFGGILAGIGASISIISAAAIPALVIFSRIATVTSIVGAAIIKFNDILIGAAKIAFDNFAKLGKALEKFVTDVGKGFAETVTTLSAVMSVLVSSVVSLTGHIVGITADIINAINSFKEFGFVVEVAAKALGALIAALTIAKAFIVIKAAVLAAAAALGVFIAAVKASKVALLRSPLFLLALAIEGVAFAIDFLSPALENTNRSVTELNASVNDAYEELGIYKDTISGVIHEFGKLSGQAARVQVEVAISNEKSIVDTVLDWMASGAAIMIGAGPVPKIEPGDAGNAAYRKAYLEYVEQTLQKFEADFAKINEDRAANQLSEVTRDQFNRVLSIALSSGLTISQLSTGTIFKGTIFDPQKISTELVGLINSLEPFNPLDIESAYENFIEKYDFDNITQSQFLTIAQSLDRVSTDVARGYPELEEAMANVVNNMSKMTSAELRQALMTEVGDRLLIEWQDDPTISESARETLEIIAKQYSIKLSEESERFGENTVSGMAKAITDAISFSVQEALLISIPELPDIVSDISAAIYARDPQSLASIMTSLTSPLANGQTLIQMMKSGGVPDELKNAFVTALEFAVNEGALSSSVLADFKSTTTVGSDVAEFTITSVVKDLYDGLGNRKEWMKEVKEANRQGSVGKNISSVLSWIQSNAFRNMPKTKYARIKADETAIANINDIVNVAMYGGKAQSRKAIEQLIKVKPEKTSKAVRQYLFQSTKRLFEQGKISADDFKRMFPRASKKSILDAYVDAIYGTGTGEKPDIETGTTVQSTPYMIAQKLISDTRDEIKKPESVGEVEAAVANVMTQLILPSSQPMQQAYVAGQTIGKQIYDGVVSAVGVIADILFPGSSGSPPKIEVTSDGVVITYPDEEPPPRYEEPYKGNTVKTETTEDGVVITYPTDGSGTKGKGRGKGRGRRPVEPEIPIGSNQELTEDGVLITYPDTVKTGPMFGPYAQPTIKPLWSRHGVPYFGGRTTGRKTPEPKKNKLFGPNAQARRMVPPDSNRIEINRPEPLINIDWSKGDNVKIDPETFQFTPQVLFAPLYAQVALLSAIREEWFDFLPEVDLFGFGKNPEQTIEENFSGKITPALQSVATEMGTLGDIFSGVNVGGFNVGNAWSNGIASGVGTARDKIITEVQALLDLLQGESPPKKGPLKAIDKGGYNIGTAWGKGLADGISEKGKNYVRKAQNNLMSKEFSGGAMEISGSSKKEIRIKIDVSSPDGSVDRIKQGELRRSVMDALVINGLEHYATID